MGFRVVPIPVPDARTFAKLPQIITGKSPFMVLVNIEGNCPDYNNSLRRATSQANFSGHNDSIELVPLLTHGISSDQLRTFSTISATKATYSELSPGQSATVGLGTVLVPLNEFDTKNQTRLREFIGKRVAPYIELFFNSDAKILPNEDVPVSRGFLYRPVHVYSHEGLTADRTSSALSHALDGQNLQPTHMMLHFLLNGTTLRSSKVPYIPADLKNWADLKKVLLGIANVGQYFPPNLFDNPIPQLLHSAIAPLLSTLFKEINFPVANPYQILREGEGFQIPIGQMYVPGLTLGTFNTMSQQLMEASQWMAENGVLPHTAMGGIHPLFNTKEEILAALWGIPLQPQIIRHSPNVLTPIDLLNAHGIPFLPPLNGSGLTTLDAVRDRVIQSLPIESDLRGLLNQALQQLRGGSSLDSLYQLPNSSGGELTVRSNFVYILNGAIQLMNSDVSPLEALERAIHRLYSGEIQSPQFLGENYSDLGFRQANFY